MKPGGDKMLARATAALTRAEAHLAAGAHDRALERAYHAIFHAARAVLNEAGERARSHLAIADRVAHLAPFGPASLGAAIERALACRSDPDDLTPDDAQTLVTLAGLVVRDVRAFVDDSSSLSSRK